MKRTNTALAASLLALITAAMPTHADDLSKAVEKDYSYIEALYKNFHANPELSFKESKSAKRIATELRGLGFKVSENIGREWTKNKAIADVGEALEGVDGYGVCLLYTSPSPRDRG